MLELSLAIVVHALLGVALAGAVWALGAGWLRLAGGGPLPYAYPLGLLAATLAAWLVLVTPWLLPLAGLLLVPAVLGLRLPWAQLARASPFALGLGAALGALLHGPTEDRASHAFGDMLFYAAKLVSARESVLPFRDLLVAGESSTYVESGSTFLGAALPEVDPILFQAATMPAFLVAALAVGLATLTPPRRAADAALLALLGVAVVAYPTWISESPPVALAVPLGVSVYALLREPLPPRAFAAVVLVLAADFVLTKGFGLAPLAIVAGFALRGRLDRRRALRYGGLGLAAAAVGLAFYLATSAWLTEVLAARFLPKEALDGLLDQLDHRDTQAAAPAALVAGEVLLLAVLARAREPALLAAAAASILGSWLVGGHGFDITIGLAVLFALALIAERPDELRRQRVLVAAAAVALALSALFRDISGIRAGFVFALLLAGGIYAALASLRVLLPVAAAVAAVLATGGLGDFRVTLTPEHRAVWRDVEQRVPEDGLVFTSETGPVITGDQGWNYYPGLAGRQVYLAGWSNSPLLVDDERRARRLRLNREVLGGDVAPGRIAPGYEAYFAVVRRSRRVGKGFGLVYANQRFAVYLIP